MNTYIYIYVCVCVCVCVCVYLNKIYFVRNYDIMWPFGFSWNQRSRFHFRVSVLFFFFFSAWTVNLLCRDKNDCLGTVAVLFTYCSSTVHALKILKMGPTVLFTHLKIILLQCFQFSIFSFQFSVSATISSIQTDPIYMIMDNLTMNWFRYPNQ